MLWIWGTLLPYKSAFKSPKSYLFGMVAGYLDDASRLDERNATIAMALDYGAAMDGMDHWFTVTSAPVRAWHRMETAIAAIVRPTT